MGEQERSDIRTFDITKEPFKTAYEQIVQQKYAGYRELVNRNQREDRQGTREKQEGA